VFGNLTRKTTVFACFARSVTRRAAASQNTREKGRWPDKDAGALDPVSRPIRRKHDDGIRGYKGDSGLSVIDSVLPLFESAEKRLADLEVAWGVATPFPTTTEKRGSFSGQDWRRWILSVESSDTDGVQALTRFTVTCGRRLGEVNAPVDDLLQRLVDVPQETLGVELKPWLLPTEHDSIGKIAKARIALRNNNGGYLLLGFENDGTPSPSSVSRNGGSFRGPSNYARIGWRQGSSDRFHV